MFFLVLFMAVASKTLPPRGVIPVLAYHSIGTREDAKELKNFVSRQSFTYQMAFLYYFGFRVISLSEYEQILLGQKKPLGREVVITFDDANQTFEQEAFPILKQYAFPAALFVVSESMKRQINGSLSFEAMEDLLKSGLITLGSGSRTHAMIPSLTKKKLRSEVNGSKADLEKIFRTPVHYFAYPNGDLDVQSISVIKDAGYHLAFTTSHHKLNGVQETPFSITRLQMSRSSDNPLVFWVKVTGLYQIHKEKWEKFKTWFMSFRRSG